MRPRRTGVAYIYQVSFDISPAEKSELEVGASLERVLGMLRVLLPAEPGYTTARAVYSLETPGRTRVVVESVWDHWEDLVTHRRSSLAEDKILREFADLALEMLEIRTFREVD
jgi:hypothetical protein